MSSETLLQVLQASAEFSSLYDGMRRGFAEQMVYGVAGSLKSAFLAALRERTGRPALVITATIQQAEQFREDLETWLPGQDVALFPPMEYLPFEVMAHSPEVIGQRLSVLERLARGESLIVVAPAAALYRGLTPSAVFRRSLLTLRPGQAIGRDELVARLVRQGYERVDMVESKGHVAVRGEIVDLFPLAAEYPLRVAFWGDEIEEIRRFDPATQRTVEQVDALSVGPAREFILPEDGLEPAIARIRRDLAETVARLRRIQVREAAARAGEARVEAAGAEAGGAADGEVGKGRAGRGRRRRKDVPSLPLDAVDAAQKLEERVEGHLARLQEQIYFPGLEQYATFFYDQLETLIDYFPERPLILVDEPARIRDASVEAEGREADRQAAMMERGHLLPGQLGLYIGYQELFQRCRQGSAIYFSALGRGIPGIRPANEVGLSATTVQEFHGQWPLFAEELRRWKKQGFRIVILVGTEDRQRRIRELLQEAEMESGAGAAGSPVAVPPPGGVWVGLGSLEGGFQWPGQRLVVVTDREIQGRQRRRRRGGVHGTAGATGRQGARIASYQDLQVGDYVVHATHGIGRYLGVRSETILGVTRDYLVIQYEGSDRLKIPTEQVDQIQKYIGAEGHEPRLNRLGGGEWAKVKSRVKESIREMAAELLRLAALRETLPGTAFPPDTPWQREFEDAFPYEETPDQLTAIAEIKADMEKARPMDRLLLGDVGYGKTEVALRAAFKAATAGKQVAILVPTTILAQQHYATCKSRMEGFPINLAVLNRFKSPKEQAEIIRGLAEGTIDVVIGTHRLLSDDVKFKDLGLLIVDEEQRFGVAHKERIKQLRANVDVLTLSATPIPRTLHMAMVGLRDMSIITTPPEDRYPVETFVAEYDDALVQDAIGRELSRGGQVFYVHNRIQTLDDVAARLHRLVPEARIAVAHGQMSEDRLEKIVLDFMDGEYDVLVATTIIENGIDMPQVNTIIVEDADHLGLSQLYQLRGRVGRSNRLAYAYFLYRRDKVLTEASEKRLRAIKDFTELGSGFKIAMRDLEIRGAGNILGPEQHGFIVSVGFDLYCQLLEEAVRELKGEPAPEPEIQPNIELQVDAFISDQYVPDARQKIDAYKRIIAIRSMADVEDVADELVDRFGSLPDPVKNLLDIARLRVHCNRLGITSIAQMRDRVTVKFLPSAARAVPFDRLALLNRRPEFRGRIETPRTRGGTSFTVKVGGLDARSLLRTLLLLLEQLHAEVAQTAAR
ncbi:transcription-repair coupling factor [Symbiobacterium thermophilum]|uniref:Transcription-repair-coupling factor n=1 Tax=Symbiobacterium thermophilum (strain DSM 24528 / JCM 14929 / IAM 14863 / T) TaxID=292459 RepID=Q67JD3_SYMTH|nr:transcription-repair coupling factor [Symbiobacterium thermophilum]BAD42217.1 transcription-repair coupling factor [Symbiobacterium thermophilum IAM 14863]